MSMPRCRIIFPGIRTSVRSFLVREASDARTLVRAFFFLRRQVCGGGDLIALHYSPISFGQVAALACIGQARLSHSRKNGLENLCSPLRR